MSDFVTARRQHDVAVLEIHNPPVNALSSGVPEALGAAVGAAGANGDVRAIVVRGAGRVFVAGADIAALEDAAWGNASAAPDWHDVLCRIEDSPTPVVMAMHGAALGGGLELAMAGHYRVAAPDTQIGQPEVNLGLIPGGEGTQRLPRLVGVRQALDMCVTGRPISAADAAAHGLLDEVAGGELTAFAVAFARRVADARPLPRTCDRRARLDAAAPTAALFASARALAAFVRRHEQAPLRAIEAIEAAAALPFDEGCRRERAIFLECIRSEQARALIHLFFAERAYARRNKMAGGAAGADDFRLDVNWLMRSHASERRFLVEEGATPDQVDRALADFGMVIGTSVPGNASGGDAAGVSRKADARRRSISDHEIVERCVYAFVNDGARALDSGGATHASDIDVMCVSRCGFPRWRGGPMFYADRMGLSQVLERIQTFHHEYGPRWKPARLLVALARDGLTFRGRDRSV